MDFLAAFNGWCGGPGFWQGGGGHGFSSWMPFHFGGIFQLIIIGLIIYFTVRMFRKPAANDGPVNSAPTNGSSASAEEILRRRYALGEIDEQTYKTMKNDLK